MTCVEIQPQLSEYVDQTLGSVDHRAVDAHLSTCADCAGLARDLGRLRAAARALGPIEPPSHLWLEIAGRTRQGLAAAPARIATRMAPVWQWGALAATLLVITAGTYLTLRLERRPSALPAPTVASAPTGSVQVVADELTQAMAHYEKAIAELEVITKNNNGALDPVLAATLQRNVVVIDNAIVESRTALAQNPASVPARDSLLEALQRKVSVLQETVALMNDVRQGDQAGVARLISRVPKQS